MKEWLIRILWLVIGLGVGILIMVYRPQRPISSSIESEKEYVDSIQTVIDSVVVEKEKIKWRIDSVVKEKEVRVDSVRNLPIPEAVEYLNRNLKEYEENY